MIDVTERVSAVRRTVGTRVLEAGEARVVTLGRTYPTDQGDLWSACTEPERIARWFAPVTGELTVGGHYQVEGNAGGTVERCDPPSLFAATWEYGGEVSWIEVRLSPAAEGTLFELEHVAHVDDERWAQFGPGAVGIGWDLGLVGLAMYLASPGFSAAAGMEWMVSPEGRDFVTRASEQWMQASIEAGTPAEAAQSAGAGTTAFYTGA